MGHPLLGVVLPEPHPETRKMLLTSNPTTTDRHIMILSLLTTCESLGSQDIRTRLGCTAADAHTVLEELIAQGLIRADNVRNSVRYSKRNFDHDQTLVCPEWFEHLEDWFAQGKSESASGMARLLGLNPLKLRATLEEMRQRGTLYGRFVGQMCVYSLRQRGETSQATAAQMHALHNTPEKRQQEALMHAGNAPMRKGVRVPIPS